MGDRREPSFDKDALDAILKGGAGKSRTKTPTPDEIKRQIEAKITELIGKFGKEGDQQKQEAIRKDLEVLNSMLVGMGNGKPGGSEL